MRLIKYVILGILAICLVVVALANRELMTVQLLPDELSRLVGLQWQITLPAFVILMVAGVIGLLLGFVWEWVREHKHRATAVTERRERQRLEQEVRKVAPPAKSGDDVLAILDGQS